MLLLCSRGNLACRTVASAAAAPAHHEHVFDGWSYGRQRDNAKRRYPLLVHWEELKKSPDQVSKDVNVVLETRRFVAKRANRQAGHRKVA
jgi:hypothetical protein